MCYLSMLPSQFSFLSSHWSKPKDIKVSNIFQSTHQQSHPSVSGLGEPVAQIPGLSIKETEAQKFKWLG